MKKVLTLLLALVLVLSFAVACGTDDKPAPTEEKTEAPKEEKTEAPKEEEKTEAPEVEETEPVVEEEPFVGGVAIYKYDDSFMTSVRNHMNDRAEQLEGKLEMVDSQNKQPTQNDQVDTFLTKGLKVLGINPVDRTSAASLIEKVKAKDVPIVFFNREPEEQDMQSYDKTWYVGARAEESGTLSGELVVDYFAAHPEADKNGDGVIQYVMLTGEPGHQDAILRTEYSIKAIEDAGWQVEKLAEDTAYWDKVKGTDLMNTFITAQGLDNIEAVLGNNDDMALGAIEALKAKGYNTDDPEKYIPVVGVDATAPALQAMAEGSLYGTVLNDAKNQGYATVNIMAAALAGKEINEANVGYEVTDGKYVWIPYVKVTLENYREFQEE